MINRKIFCKSGPRSLHRSCSVYDVSTLDTKDATDHRCGRVAVWMTDVEWCDIGIGWRRRHVGWDMLADVYHNWHRLCMPYKIYTFMYISFNTFHINDYVHFSTRLFTSSSAYLIILSHVQSNLPKCSEWVSEQFFNGISAHYRLFSAIKLKVAKSSES